MVVLFHNTPQKQFVVIFFLSPHNSVNITPKTSTITPKTSTYCNIIN